MNRPKKGASFPIARSLVQTVWRSQAAAIKTVALTVGAIVVASIPSIAVFLIVSIVVIIPTVYCFLLFPKRNY